MRKIWTCLLPAALLFSAVQVAAAGEIQVIIDGVKQSYDQPPVVISGSTMVPLRGIFESLGATIALDGKNITAAHGETIIQLTIGASIAIVNGQTVTLAQASQVINGRTLVPLRFVSEALGATVDYKNGIVTVVSLGSQTASNRSAEPEATVTYASCAEVRAAGAAPLRKGEPGYSSRLDRDGDGVACE